jgi:thiamine-phosphate pyrophosphorylase
MTAPRLYLITPPLSGADLAGFVPRLAAAFDAGDVASLLVRFAPGGEAAAKRIVSTLTEIAAARDSALLIEGDPRLAARLGADGVHVGWEDAADAVATFKSQRIVGAGGLRLRDDAMTAAEAGADYVMFGEPAPDGAPPPLSDLRERVRWWAEIFETPSVAYAARLEDVEPLAADGADFIALAGAIFDAADPEAATAEAMSRLSGVPL